MIVAFVGTIDEDDSALPITGNGKTAGVTGFAFNDFNDMEHPKEIWSNFYTDFSAKVIGFQEMINNIQESVDSNTINPNVILCVTEMRRILDAVGSTTEQVLFIDNFVEQIRKMDCVLYYDTQRFNSIHKRLRIHTNVILIPYKVHLDNQPCYLPSCMKPHKIYIYSHKPFKRLPVACFDAVEVGKHYVTKEFCKDKLTLPKKVKGVIT